MVKVVLLMLMAAVPLAAQAPVSGAAPPKGDAENGKKIYDAYGCYQCHNYAAHGGGAGPRLAPGPLPYESFRRYIREPTGQMPPYTTKSLSDQEIADIYAFLRTIPAPPAVDSIPLLRKE